MTTVNIDTMTKIELRTACKAAGITGYSKMDNAGMRAALVAALPAAHPAPAASVPVSSDLPAETAAVAAAPENVVTTPAPVAPAAPTAKAPKEKKEPAAPIEKRNGVAMPKVGTVCRAIWDKADELGSPTIKEMREHAVAAGWDKTTVAVQFYRWRKFHGIAQQKKEIAAA